MRTQLARKHGAAAAIFVILFSLCRSRLITVNFLISRSFWLIFRVHAHLLFAAAAHWPPLFHFSSVQLPHQLLSLRVRICARTFRIVRLLLCVTNYINVSNALKPSQCTETEDNRNVRKKQQQKKNEISTTTTTIIKLN